MKITEMKIKVGELISNFSNKGEEGVTAYGGNLNIRPPYQREFVYNLEQQQLVIDTILMGFPLSTFYWNKIDGDKYELLDGQQRTMSICNFVCDGFSIIIGKTPQLYSNLTKEQKDKILTYEMNVYVCEGTEHEKLLWFERINIVGLKLTPQELRNAAYTGAWLQDAKRIFSKSNCAAYNLSKDYVKGSPLRQEILETAIEWKVQADNLKTTEEYMAKYRSSDNADDLWQYFQQVFGWVKLIFPTYYREMKGIKWGLLYNKYKNISTNFDNKVKVLYSDYEVGAKKGIFEYLLSNNEKHLSLRAFDLPTKAAKLAEQKGLCPICFKNGENKVYKIEEMEADHITPWSKGGKTNIENCQLLCIKHNREKSNK